MAVCCAVKEFAHTYVVCVPISVDVCVCVYTHCEFYYPCQPICFGRKYLLTQIDIHTANTSIHTYTSEAHSAWMVTKMLLNWRRKTMCLNNGHKELTKVSTNTHIYTYSEQNICHSDAIVCTFFWTTFTVHFVNKEVIFMLQIPGNSLKISVNTDMCPWNDLDLNWKKFRQHAKNETAWSDLLDWNNNQ